MYQNLFDHIKKYVSLTSTDEGIIASALDCRTLKNKEFVLEEGQICSANYFVANGCLRMFEINSNGADQILQFGIDNWWITDYNSLDFQRPSKLNIQAVQSSTVIVLPNKIQEELFQKIPALERYFRLILQRAYSASQLRVHYIFNQSGEERYRHFSSSFPDFVQRVPQYMLASYLGFTPEFLSKIRGKKE